MTFSSHKQLSRIARTEILRGARSWCVGLSIVAFALALTSVVNTIHNPDTWASAFHAFAASGEFTTYAVWLSLVGFVFLVPALILTIYLEKLK